MLAYLVASVAAGPSPRTRALMDRVDALAALVGACDQFFERLLQEQRSARARLETLQRLGPTAQAFTFREPFPAPGDEAPQPVLDECA